VYVAIIHDDVWTQDQSFYMVLSPGHEEEEQVPFPSHSNHTLGYQAIFGESVPYFPPPFPQKPPCTRETRTRIPRPENPELKPGTRNPGIPNADSRMLDR
jgi:hypothetical protein